MLKIAMRLFGFIIFFLAAYVTSVMIHELGHFITIEALGGEAKVKFTYLFNFFPLAGQVAEISLAGEPRWTIYLMGGLFGAAFPWFFSWFIAWRTQERGDAWIEAVSASIMLVHIFYAPVELLLWVGNVELFPWMTGLSVIVGQAIFYLLYLKVMINWLDVRCGTPARKQACRK